MGGRRQAVLKPFQPRPLAVFAAAPDAVGSRDCLRFSIGQLTAPRNKHGKTPVSEKHPARHSCSLGGRGVPASTRAETFPAHGQRDDRSRKTQNRTIRAGPCAPPTPV